MEQVIDAVFTSHAATQIMFCRAARVRDWFNRLLTENYYKKTKWQWNKNGRTMNVDGIREHCFGFIQCGALAV